MCRDTVCSEVTQAPFPLHINAAADAVCRMQAVKRKLVMAEMGTRKDTVAGVLLQEVIAEVFVHISANFIILSIQYINII